MVKVVLQELLHRGAEINSQVIILWSERMRILFRTAEARMLEVFFSF